MSGVGVGGKELHRPIWYIIANNLGGVVGSVTGPAQIASATSEVSPKNSYAFFLPLYRDTGEIWKVRITFASAGFSLVLLYICLLSCTLTAQLQRLESTPALTTYLTYFDGGVEIPSHPNTILSWSETIFWMVVWEIVSNIVYSCSLQF